MNSLQPESPNSDGPVGYELRFESLSQPGRRFSFPCDAVGAVDDAALGEAARASYQRVLALVGREYSAPVVVRV